MSSGLDGRERAEEARFHHDQDFEFRVVARRDRLIGIWAAAQLGLTPEETERYVASIIDLPVTAHGDDRLVQRLKEDFRLRGKPMTDATLWAELALWAREARTQIEASARAL